MTRRGSLFSRTVVALALASLAPELPPMTPEQKVRGVFAELLRKAGIDPTAAALDALDAEVQAIMAANRMAFDRASFTVADYLTRLADRGPGALGHRLLVIDSPFIPGTQDSPKGRVYFHSPGAYSYEAEDGSPGMLTSEPVYKTSVAAWIAAGEAMVGRLLG